jgi:hypothetical protein
MATTSKLSDSTPFGGDDNAALIAELKRQGFRYVIQSVKAGGNEASIVSPMGVNMVPWCNPGENDEDVCWKETCERLKTSPLSKYVQERLNVLARVLVLDIYVAERGAALQAVIECERMAQPEWRRAVMLAGKILSLDLGPVHGS